MIGHCALCQKSLGSVQVHLPSIRLKYGSIAFEIGDLVAEPVDRLEFCQPCQKVKLDKIMLIGKDGFRALVEDEVFEEHICRDIPENRIYELSREQAEKIALEVTKCDDDYQRGLRSLDNVYEEIEILNGELAELEMQAEDTKKDLLSTRNYYFEEIFNEIPKVPAPPSPSEALSQNEKCRI